MKNFKFMALTVIAASVMGSAAMAADAVATTDTTIPVVKTETKADVKAPIVKKHMKHSKKAPIVKSDEKLDTSKIDSSTTIAK